MANTLVNPLLEYWPKATSKNKRQLPTNNIKIMYNHTKAAKTYNCKTYYSDS